MTDCGKREIYDVKFFVGIIDNYKIELVELSKF